MGLPYLDTSALAKWYLNEAGSEEFESYILPQAGAWISTLTQVEMRCLLARRRRTGDFDGVFEAIAFATFQEDLRSGVLRCRAVADDHFHGALQLIAALPQQPLRSLDALHLAVATELGVEELASADKVMIEAAEALGLRVVRFDLPAGR